MPAADSCEHLENYRLGVDWELIYILMYFSKQNITDLLLMLSFPYFSTTNIILPFSHLTHTYVPHIYREQNTTVRN